MSSPSERAEDDAVSECQFCGQHHPTDSDKTFLGAPIQVCPNLPKRWVLIDGRIMEVEAGD